jgi:hypothetical protein
MDAKRILIIGPNPDAQLRHGSLLSSINLYEFDLVIWHISSLPTEWNTQGESHETANNSAKRIVELVGCDGYVKATH